MLSIERRVVNAMITTDDPAERRFIEDHVGGALAAMPEFIRVGISGLSVLVGGWARLRRLRDRSLTPADDLSWASHHPLGLVRQWVRALRSLVLFAEQETIDARPVAGADPHPFVTDGAA